MNRKLTPIASAVTLLVLGASMSAQAQQAAPADQQSVETVTVTGIRASLQQSLTQKRDSTDHVEVITSEDIGKMPDKNVADSLQRVPGVTISSAGGTEGGFDEADRVSMRGTNPSLTLTTINGHGVASGDWFVLDQSGTVGRSVSYTLIPSELVGSVVVHKSSEASLIEGGVAGTVDIITRKPLDFKNQFTAEATIGAVYAELPGKTDPQFNGLFNWKNDQKTFGLLIQAFDEKRHLERDGQELLDWATIAPGTTVAKSNPNLSGVWYPGLIGSTLFTQERTRKGGEFDAQFKVSNDFSFDLNGFTSKLDAPNYNRNYMLWGSQILQGGNGQAPNPGYSIINNVLTNATFAPVAGTHYGVYDEINRPDESESSDYLALDGKWRVNSDLRFTGKLGVARGDGKTPTQDVSEQDFGTGAGASWAMNGMGSATSWMVGNSPSAVSPSSATFGWVFGDQDIDVKDSEDWAQIDGEYSIGQGIFTTLKFGVRWNDHERKSDGIIGQGPGCVGGTPLTWSGTYNCGGTTNGSYNLANLGGAPGGTYPSGFASGLGGSFPTNVWYYTPAQLAAYDTFSNRSTNGSREDWTQEFDVKENDTAAYVQSDFEGNGWSGNAGLRFVNTQERSLVNTSEPAVTASSPALPGEITTSAFGNYVPIWIKHNYTDVLPSLNLKFDLTKDLVARFSASKTMTRADYSALSGTVTLNMPGTGCSASSVVNGQLVGTGCVPGSGTGGNPNLAPIVSNNIDGTIEWYFAPHSLLSASLFEMDLTSYVGYGSVLETYQSAGGNGVAQNSVQPYYITTEVNISAIVKGIELAYEQPIGKNFGFATNYTYINAVDANGDPVVGASKNTANLSGYYEDNHFNARVAYTWRSSFYSGLDRSTAFYQDSTGTLAATLGYKYNDNLSFTLDGMNLNNPILKYFGPQGDSQPERFYENGRQYYLSMHLKY